MPGPQRRPSDRNPMSLLGFYRAQLSLLAERTDYAKDVIYKDSKQKFRFRYSYKTLKKIKFQWNFTNFT